MSGRESLFMMKFSHTDSVAWRSSFRTAIVLLSLVSYYTNIPVTSARQLAVSDSTSLSANTPNSQLRWLRMAAAHLIPPVP